MKPLSELEEESMAIMEAIHAAKEEFKRVLSEKHNFDPSFYPLRLTVKFVTNEDYKTPYRTVTDEDEPQ